MTASERIREIALDAIKRAPKRPAIGFFRKYWEVVERMHPDLSAHRSDFLQIVEGRAR